MQDYHVHTTFSADSELTMEQACKQSMACGIKELAITEHVDFDPQDIGYAFLNYSAYTETFLKLKEKYWNTLNLVKGMEIGIQSYYKAECSNYLRDKSFDFIIGSVHMVDHQDLHSGAFYLGRTEEDAYTTYLLETVEAIKSCPCFDVLGHLDLVCRYSSWSRNLVYPKFEEAVEEILLALIHEGRGIEVNTSGFRYGKGDACPSFNILEHYFRLGGEIITFGSDAHHPSHIGYNIFPAMEQAKQAGFRYFTVFKERKPEFLPLP